jgi:outer membrane protein TolC
VHWMTARVVVCITVLMGCAVGPDFKRPTAPDTQFYTTTALPAETASAPGVGGKAQRFKMGERIPDQWWSLFHSEALDRLIRLALAHNPTAAAAQATLRQARENYHAQYGASLFPSIDANLSASRERLSGAAFGQSKGGGTTFELYNASVNVSYMLDVFGGARRELEALQAQVDYQSFLMQGIYLTLAANIVTAARCHARPGSGKTPGVVRPGIAPGIQHRLQRPVPSVRKRIEPAGRHFHI